MTELSLDTIHVHVDPKSEWAEMFDNSWRLERDFFYNTEMNGVDWNAVHESYRKLLPLVGSREDLNYLIGQMIGELGNSHTYVGGGDDGSPPIKPIPATPALGADFALDAASGRYRFATVFQGDNTRDYYRSPLTAPGANVKEGDFLLAINGVELKAPQTPDELLVGINPNESVTLTVAMLERLRRIQNRLDVNRQRAADSGHNQFMPGPKIVVINHYSVSEGDMFPYLFREYGLGKLLGTRTWGGVRAERGKWAMMDNGYVEIPEWSLYNSKSQWVLENHGVEPDPGMEVENLPGELISGHDKQLETAVAVLLKKISGERAGLPPPPPLLPAYPADGDVPGPAH